MNWTKKDFPTIEGYEQLGDNVEAKRWLSFSINELLDTGDPLWEYRSKIKTREDACNFVISQFDYPMHLGVPTDLHKNNWFNGSCCHGITQDFWQTASETLRTLHLNQRSGRKGYGDCEDVSVLFTTLFLMKKWEAYECLGYVLENEQILGGHGWSIFRDKMGYWRLYEATLSEPPAYPDGYPIIDLKATKWYVGTLVYQGLAKFNRHEYYESEEGGILLKLRLRDKETRKKHRAISRAWDIRTKPLKKISLIGRLRWR